MTAFAKRFNAQRAAKSALGKDAAEGKEFATTKAVDGQWVWAPIPAPEAIKSKPRATKSTGITPPDFSAKTHARFRGKLAAVVALVEARDVDGLRKFHVNPVSTSPRAILRYRDAALAAFTA